MREDREGVDFAFKLQLVNHVDCSPIPGAKNDRVPHIHIKAFLPGGQQINTQFYFTNEFCDELYTTQPPYNRYGRQDFRFKDDIALALAGDGKGVILTVNKKLKDD